MKGSAEIYQQQERILKALLRKGNRLAAAMDPEFGKSEYAAQTWGNEAAKKVWEIIRTRAREVETMCSRLFQEAEHREHYARGFRPLWCRFCQEKKQKRRAPAAGKLKTSPEKTATR